MEKLLKNEENSFYRVNENVPFEKDWFKYLLVSPLPSYYSIISVDVIFSEFTDVKKLTEILSNHFALVTIVKYKEGNNVVLQIVTNKPIQMVNDILNKIEFCKCFC